MDQGLGFVRVAAAVPAVVVADPMRNAEGIGRLYQRAILEGAQVVVFPELSLTGYTCGDLFHQTRLLRAATEGLQFFLDVIARIVDNNERRSMPLAVVGMPLVVDDQLFNVAVVCHDGKPVAIIPKTYLPGYKEFYETRWFASAERLTNAEVGFLGRDVPIGTDLLIEVTGDPTFRLGVEICEDLWMPIPPSSRQALHGATVLVNLSASNSLIGKAEYRRDLIRQQSSRCLAAYVYASCGHGESTSDVVFDGHALIAENGVLLKESERFRREESLLVADVDVGRLVRERVMTGSFGQSVSHARDRIRIVPATPFDHLRPASGGPVDLRRDVDPHPFVPSDHARRDERCEEIFSHQVAGLGHRLEHLESRTGNRKVAIGISGGLDSTLALLATVRTYDAIGWDRSGINAVTMPGPGTSDRTYDNAVALIRALGVTFTEISILASVLQDLRDLGHKACWECLLCENAQARKRTSILMNLGFTVGTGDLSEIALGWSTYNGDQQSMYNPNCGIPKTLIKHVVEWVAGSKEFVPVAAILRDILDTPISPELTKAQDGKVSQKTEEIVGPYELQDFFLFHVVRNGFEPRKILFLAMRAFAGRYDEQTITRWLRVFYKRFADAQFKRDAAPDGPKIGSVALSQRGDWRMPSDVTLRAWLEQIKPAAT